jgi:hypothetical protein
MLGASGELIQLSFVKKAETWLEKEHAEDCATALGYAADWTGGGR